MFNVFSDKGRYIAFPFFNYMYMAKYYNHNKGTTTYWKSRRSKPKDDFLKFYPIAERYVLERYNITRATLSILLFMYTEDYFDREMFNQFQKLVWWRYDRLKRMVSLGFVDKFPYTMNSGKLKYYYALSSKGDTICRMIYAILRMDREVSVLPRLNPMMRSTKANAEGWREWFKIFNTEVKRLRVENAKNPPDDGHDGWI